MVIVGTPMSELFEYENEFIDTSIAEVDNQLKDEGYITTIDLVGIGKTAQATVGVSSGRVTNIFLNNDGSGFTSAPTITFLMNSENINI